MLAVWNMFSAQKSVLAVRNTLAVQNTLAVKIISSTENVICTEHVISTEKHVSCMKNPCGMEHGSYLYANKFSSTCSVRYVSCTVDILLVRNMLAVQNIVAIFVKLRMTVTMCSRVAFDTVCLG